MRRSATLGSILAVAFVAAACSRVPSPGSVSDATPLDARLSDGSVADSTVSDGPVLELADAALSDLAPTVLPLGPDAVVSISEPGALDIYGTAFLTNDAVTVVYERFDEPFTLGRLHTSTSTDGSTFAPPRALEGLGSHALRGGPSSVANALYFIEADSTGGPAFVSRALGLAAAQLLPAISGVDSILSWPRFLGLAGGRSAVVFRDGRGRGHVGFSDDGLTFDDFTTPEVGPLAQAELGQHPDGSFVFTFQTPVGNEPMISFVRLSADAVQWDTAFRLSTASSNVHDARVFRRSDGGLDIYYIYPLGLPGFSIFRRSISVGGELGPEEQVTTSELGDATKPAPQRLSDGRILLLYAEITRRAPQGYPSEQILRALWIRGDAP